MVLQRDVLLGIHEEENKWIEGFTEKIDKYISKEFDSDMQYWQTFASNVK